MASSWLDALRLTEEDRARGETAIVSALVAALAVAATALVVYGAYFGLVTALVLRSLFFSLVASGGLLLLGLRAGHPAGRAALYALAPLALIPGLYIQANYLDIVMRGGMAQPQDIWIFAGRLAALVVLIVRGVGWALLVLVAVAIAYAMLGNLIPGEYGHRGYSVRRLASMLMLSTEGIFGLPMGVAVQYIFLFALLGGLLMKIGTGEVFVDIARGLTGRMRGGPGLTAALSSTMLGTINGSAVANVVTTGTFTIPLMKRAGYSPTLAGAIEAAASSAGQILPPVMGAAAFLMAEIIQVPYATIALAALIPGLLYVLALMVAVWLEAGRLGLDRDPEAGFALLRDTLVRRGYLLLPLAALVGFLAAGYTPTRAAVLCMIVALALSPWRRETRVGLLDLVVVCRDTLIATLPIVVAVAAAGVVIGVLNLTGLGLMLSSFIVDLSAGNLPVLLVLTAIVSFVLGMGLPTSAAYLLLAVLVAPALTRMGMEPVVAHMFIFYYGLVSAITPPVALAAYAAASISGGEPNRTAFESIRLGFVKLLVPFLFATMPGLLWVGSGPEIAVSTVLAAVGIVGLTVSFAGWLHGTMPGAERLALALGSVLVLWPDAVLSTDPVTLAARAGGLVLVTVLLSRRLLRGDARTLPAKALK